MSSIQKHSPRFGNASSSIATTVTSHFHPGHEQIPDKSFASNLADEFKAFEAEFAPPQAQTNASATNTHANVTTNPTNAAPAYNYNPNAQAVMIRQDAYTTLHPAVIQQDAYTTLQPKGSAYPQSFPAQQKAPVQNTIPQAAPNSMENGFAQQTSATNAFGSNIQQEPIPYNPAVPEHAAPVIHYAQAPIYIPGYISNSSFMRKNRLNLNNNDLANGAFSAGKKSKVAVVTKDIAAIGGPAAVASAVVGLKVGVLGSFACGGHDLGITGPMLASIMGGLGGLAAIGKSGFDINRNKKAYLEEIARVKDAALATGKVGLIKGQWKFSPTGSARRANDRAAESINRDLSQGINDKVYRLKMPNGFKTMSVYVPGAQEAQKYLTRANG